MFGHPAPGPLVLPHTGESFERSPLDDFQALGRLSKNLGIDAVYVLVDRVDELEHTQNDWREAYRLVAPLLTNLSVVECPPFAFKFFLTSELEDMITTSRESEPEAPSTENIGFPDATVASEPASRFSMLAMAMGAFVIGYAAAVLQFWYFWNL